MTIINSTSLVFFGGGTCSCRALLPSWKPTIAKLEIQEIYKNPILWRKVLTNSTVVSLRLQVLWTKIMLLHTTVSLQFPDTTFSEIVPFSCCFFMISYVCFPESFAHRNSCQSFCWEINWSECCCPLTRWSVGPCLLFNFFADLGLC